MARIKQIPTFWDKETQTENAFEENTSEENTIDSKKLGLFIMGGIAGWLGVRATMKVASGLFTAVSAISSETWLFAMLLLPLFTTSIVTACIIFFCRLRPTIIYDIPPLPPACMPSPMPSRCISPISAEPPHVYMQECPPIPLPPMLTFVCEERVDVGTPEHPFVCMEPPVCFPVTVTRILLDCKAPQCAKGVQTPRQTVVELESTSEDEANITTLTKPLLK